jgi:hypothetical protein
VARVPERRYLPHRSWSKTAMDKVTLAWAAAVIALLGGLALAAHLYMGAIVSAATGGGLTRGAWTLVHAIVATALVATVVLVAILVRRAVRITRSDWR